QIKKISIHRGGGGLANFVVLANSKLTGFTAVSYFFTLTRDEPKKSPRLWIAVGLFRIMSGNFYNLPDINQPL
ncbi:hypothetical protein, partial [Marinobacter salarius]